MPTAPSRGKLPFTTDGGADSRPIAEQSSPLRRGGTRQRAGVVYHPKPWRRGKHELRATSNSHTFVIPAQAGIGSIKFVLRITDK